MTEKASRYIGARVNALNSRRLVAGRGQYAADLYLDNMLYLAFARSSYAHARIIGVETTAAQAVAGVVKVLTGAELKATMGPLESDFMGKRALIDALAADQVRYVGEPLAVVAAQDKYTARQAADLIEVEYEDLPVVVDCEQALQPGAPLVQPQWDSNLLGEVSYQAGDLDRAFAQADGRVAGTLGAHRYVGTPIEPRAYVASFEPFRGRLTIWASTQHPHQFRTALAEILKLPEANIRVILNDIGGAFGAKMPLFPDEAVIAYLAMALARPVKWVEERTESFLAGGHAREERLWYEAAYKKDGQVTGLRVKLIADLGAPSTLRAWAQGFVTAATLPGPYKIPNCDIRMQGVVTNKCPWVAYRGFGKENAAFLMERVMDRVAAASGCDRAAVRRRNYIQPDEFPYVQVTGAVLDSGNYPASLDKLLQMLDYDNFPRLQAEAAGQGRRLGIGIAHELMPEGGARPGALTSGYDGCTVRMTPTGDLKVLSGVTSPGSGNETAIAQIVADTLGADLQRVFVVQGDTEICPFGLGNYSSRSVLIGGAAAYEAAGVIRDKLFKVAARMLEVLPADLAAEDGRIFVADAPAHALTFAQVASEIYRNSYGPYTMDLEPGLDATRYFRHPNVYHQPKLHPQGGQSNYPSWPAGAAGCVVEVDPDSGSLKLLRYCYVHDAGTIINPLLAEGNLHGAIAQGIGGALYERLVYDDSGQLNTTTFYNYTLPTAMDLPAFELAHQETPGPFNPLGCKGVGESGIGAPLSAILSAVENALPELNLCLAQTPLTPDRLWLILEQARRAASPR